jgi:hypothetical protein
VRSVAVPLQLLIHARQRALVDKSAQQLVVAGAAFMHPRKQRINHAQSTASADRLGRKSFARGDGAVVRGGVLQSPDDGCADRYHAATALSRVVYRLRG